jgi:hypothetical protein
MGYLASINCSKPKKIRSFVYQSALFPPFRRDASRSSGRHTDKGKFLVSFDKQSPIGGSSHLEIAPEGRFFHSTNPAFGLNGISHDSGTDVINLMPDNDGKSLFLPQVTVIHTKAPQLGPAFFDHAQVGEIVNDPSTVGIVKHDFIPRRQVKRFPVHLFIMTFRVRCVNAKSCVNRPGNSQDADATGTAFFFQYAGTHVHGTPGRHDIVDQEDSAVFDEFLAQDGRAHVIELLNVTEALLPAEARLTDVIFPSHQGIQNRQFTKAGQDQGQFFRLVITAFFQFPAVKGHRHQKPVFPCQTVVACVP